jgi:hypothetical protein
MEKPSRDAVKSAKGILRDYAKPALIEQEKEAWERAAREKHSDL